MVEYDMMSADPATNDMFSQPENQSGDKMHELMHELYPLCRSITGNGVRQTLRILQKEIPLTIREVASGTAVFDWTVPKEWNFKEAYVKNSRGDRIIDARTSNLHVLNYSMPVHKQVSLEELKNHLFTTPEHPEWIPYRTSYYNEKWGFCISHNQFQNLKEDTYEVFIDTSLEDGYLTYGEYVIEGATSNEVLISTHICHPSLCNDNLSGIVLAVFLAKQLAQASLKYAYRFLFIPGTIGSITWLCLNEPNVSRIKHGLVAACVGDSGKFTYKKSRQQNADIDRIVPHVLKSSGKDFEVIDFFPYGYDERQYCSPGFDLPVGCLMRTPHGQFPEYHTSADNLSFVKSEALSASLSMYIEVVGMIEGNGKYINQNPKCEPRLGTRGLYKLIGGHENSETFQLAMLWVLNQSDGINSLLDISERSGIKYSYIKDAAHALTDCGLLKEMEG
jgi:aminopeptidase-like protein